MHAIWTGDQLIIKGNNRVLTLVFNEGVTLCMQMNNLTIDLCLWSFVRELDSYIHTHVYKLTTSDISQLVSNSDLIHKIFEGKLSEVF